MHCGAAGRALRGNRECLRGYNSLTYPFRNRPPIITTFKSSLLDESSNVSPEKILPCPVKSTKLKPITPAPMVIEKSSNDDINTSLQVTDVDGIKVCTVDSNTSITTINTIIKAGTSFEREGVNRGSTQAIEIMTGEEKGDAFNSLGANLQTVCSRDQVSQRFLAVFSGF